MQDVESFSDVKLVAAGDDMSSDAAIHVVAEPAVDFSQQSAIYMDQLAKRKRKPVKGATRRTYDAYIRNWINPLIGDQPLETFGNGRMKEFATQLIANKLAPKTVGEIVTLVKQIIASAVTEEGDYLYPRVWNHQFLDLPSIGQQKQPTISDDQIKLAMQDKYNVFWSFLLGTGLRIGEAQAIRIGDNGMSSAWIPERAVIIVRTSIWNRREQDPKTLAAKREVDLHPSLNQLLIEANAGAKSGDYLFRNRRGGPIWPASLAAHLKAMNIHGFHVFRRFRTTHLRSIQGLPEQLIKFSLGHGMKADITDRYSKIFQNEALRKSWADKAGLGFALPELSIPGAPPPKPAKTSKPSKIARLTAALADAESAEPSYVAANEDLPELFFEAEVTR